MEENFIPDYSQYNEEFLIDVYIRMDRENNPIKAKALDDEIIKRFNLEPNTEINPKLIMGFINTYQRKLLGIKPASDKYLGMIKQGWIAGVVLASITLLTWSIAMLRNDTNIIGNEFAAYGIIEILGVYGLSYGVYKNSRTCAMILTIYFLIIKLYQILTIPIPQNIFAIFSLFVFGAFFIRAIIGTINYNKIKPVPAPVIDNNIIICPVCGDKNHIANYNCKCGNILKPV